MILREKSMQNQPYKVTNLQRFFLHLQHKIKVLKINIRPYQIEDTQSILDIVNHTILHSTALYDYNPRSYEQQKTILTEKIKKNFPILIAEIENKVVGFAFYSEFRYREAYQYTVEHSIYIEHQNQGKGIGKLLLQKLIESAKEQNLHTMIGVIDSENKESILFHEKFGFKTVGIIKESGYKFERWLDSVFMQLIL